MGQKIDPRGFRLAVTKDWSSRWYANNQSFASNLEEDLKIREYLVKNFGRRAAIGRVVVERPAKSIKVTLHTARPGVVIGKKGEGIEQIKKELQKFTSTPLHLNVEEIRKPELNSQIIADQVAQQLEKRVAFRRAMKRSMQAAMKLGAQGIKIETSGRLNGIEIARSEWYREGRVPLHTLRADVEYATAEALTTYGIIGVKVWVYRGDINLNKNKFFKSAKDDDKKLNNKKPVSKKAAPRKRKVEKDAIA
ncbi:MAG: 30S ribosomal protein S3 [Neisseriaceae bacterium]|jgi:small subunit ribosomal protein S3|nr:MAG: 30S ribosomal protein S3 [Neisseriaceae bacterium]